MLGMEKAPGVSLACYAPLLCNADYVNWKPDMIWFNNHQSYGTASYHVQKLMMLHQGDQEVALSQSGGEMLRAEPATVQGEIGFVSNLADIDVADVVLTNLDTNEEIRVDALNLCAETPDHLLAIVDWQTTGSASGPSVIMIAMKGTMSADVPLFWSLAARMRITSCAG